MMQVGSVAGSCQVTPYCSDVAEPRESYIRGSKYSLTATGSCPICLARLAKLSQTYTPSYRHPRGTTLAALTIPPARQPAGDKTYM